MVIQVRPTHRAETKLTKRPLEDNHVRSTDNVKFTGQTAQPKILSFFHIAQLLSPSVLRIEFQSQPMLLAIQVLNSKDEDLATQ